MSLGRKYPLNKLENFHTNKTTKRTKTNQYNKQITKNKTNSKQQVQIQNNKANISKVEISLGREYPLNKLGNCY